jgi:hypothetical protein
MPNKHALFKYAIFDLHKLLRITKFLNCIKYQASCCLFNDSVNTPNYSYRVDWSDYWCWSYLNFCGIKRNISALSSVLRKDHEESPRGKPVWRTRFQQVPPHNGRQDGVGGIASHYGMDDLGIEFPCGRGFLCPSRPVWRTTQPSVQ